MRILSTVSALPAMLPASPELVLPGKCVPPGLLRVAPGGDEGGNRCCWPQSQLLPLPGAPSARGRGRAPGEGAVPPGGGQGPQDTPWALVGRTWWLLLAPWGQPLGGRPLCSGSPPPPRAPRDGAPWPCGDLLSSAPRWLLPSPVLCPAPLRMPPGSPPGQTSSPQMPVPRPASGTDPRAAESSLGRAPKTETKFRGKK